MVRIQVGTAVALGLLLAACGGPGDSASSATPAQSVNGLSVVVESDAPFAHAADFDDRVQSTLDAALAYWGGTWALVDHHVLRLVDAPTVDCAGRESLGCFDGTELRLTTKDPGMGTVDCIEQTVLVHEIGHLVIGDVNHTDPRWMEMDSLAGELSGRVGYVQGGTVACETYVSIWRHPLGTP